MSVSRALACAATAASCLLLAGCGSLGSSTVNTTAAKTAATTGSKARPSQAAAAAKPAGLGDTIDLTDATGGKLAVTLVKVDAKPHATDDFSTPDSGKQYYAAQFRIKDVGSSAWSDSPSNCAVVKDKSGQTFQTTIIESISSGAMMPDTANLGAGDSTLGWLVFEIPSGDAVTELQFTPDSGMGQDTGQWTIG